MMKLFSMAEEPEIEEPPIRPPLWVPGARATRLLKSRPVGMDLMVSIWRVAPVWVVVGSSVEAVPTTVTSAAASDASLRFRVVTLFMDTLIVWAGAVCPLLLAFTRQMPALSRPMR
ncbi:hypothetical protein GALL_547360 [mine drainage metagenome]|uniref:Uncharacterized protein n=1 Tax=mine drainage metagenome TaxID=410659 RepID=A0A1J5P8E4_9ZZZZ